jgi:uncharacterized membrane protein
VDLKKEGAKVIPIIFHQKPHYVYAVALGVAQKFLKNIVRLTEQKQVAG